MYLVFWHFVTEDKYFVLSIKILSTTIQGIETYA